jgi:hypothetical protein
LEQNLNAGGDKEFRRRAGYFFSCVNVIVGNKSNVIIFFSGDVVTMASRGAQLLHTQLICRWAPVGYGRPPVGSSAAG